jgi:hypothetical protein
MENTEKFGEIFSSLLLDSVQPNFCAPNRGFNEIMSMWNSCLYSLSVSPTDLSIFSVMTRQVESQDCLLPAFSHSKPVNPSIRPVSWGSPICTLEDSCVFVCSKKGSLGIMAIETAELCGSGLGSEGPERVGRLLSTSGSFISFPDPISALSKISGIISNGRNKFVVFVEKTCITYRGDEAGTINQASAISVGEKVDHATWLSLESFGFVTMSGKIFKMNIFSTELPTPASSYFPEIRCISRVDSNSILIVQDTKNVTLFDLETSSKTDLSFENLPNELELPDMRIDGVCQLGTVSDFAIIATSQDGMNVVFLTVSLEDNKLECKEASMNEIFLSGSEGAPLGVMQYVEQLSLLIGGHSY